MSKPAVIALPEGQPPDKKTQENWGNLVGFMALLLKIDRRNHPERYKKPKQQ